LWFVRVRTGRLGFHLALPPLETDPEALRQAKKPWNDVRLWGQVEAQFLFATLLAGDLVPFGVLRLRPVVLPLLREGGRWALLTPERAGEQGFFRLAEWLRKAQQVWAERAKRDETGQPKIRSVLDRLDVQHGLTRQRPGGWKVFYTAGGTHLTACALNADALPPLEVEGASLPFAGLLADHTLCLYEAEGEEEALYLTAVLNSALLDTALKPLQTRGEWGERHFHKRPLEFPIPLYNPKDSLHRDLADLGRTCAERVREMAPDMARRYRSVGRARAEVRRLLERELGEIDARVRRLLGASGPGDR